MKGIASRAGARNGLARLPFAALLLALPSVVAAQQVAPKGFQSMPGDEVWQDPRLAGVSAEFKGIPLAGGVTVDLGGSVKERIEYFDPGPGLLSPRREDAFLLHRVLAHANVRFSDNLRGFVELEVAGQTGRAPAPVATDENRGDIGQAFLEATLVGTGVTVGARAGRQEMAFGSRRLVGLREGANVRQRFDGVRGWAERDGARFDVFAVRSTVPRPGALDDRADPNSTFSGAHATIHLLPKARAVLDAYVYRSTSDSLQLNEGLARDRRQTIGLRWSGATRRWNYDLEYTLQRGRFGNRRISAAAVFVDTSFVVAPSSTRPALGIRLHRSSGGSDDETVRTFNPLFGRVALINEANLQTYSNLTDVFPYAVLRPLPRLTVTGGIDLQWRTSRADGFYAPPLRSLYLGEANGRSRLGNVYNLEADWAASPNLTVTVAAVRYEVRGFLKEAGAHDTNWVGFWSTFRF